jgi:two-component system response regulator FlrC
LSTSPLRERRDDVLPLAMRLLTARCRPGERIPALSADAAHLLLTYPWPGNVRELDNVMQRALILANGPVIQAEHMQMEATGVGMGPGTWGPSEPIAAPVQAPGFKPDGLKPHDLSSSVSATERETILDALRADNGNRALAAKRLGISPRTLRYKLARLRDAGVEV